MKEIPHLNRLSPEVVNQIAAGEVIERPASVLKELVDNSIDAQASKISIKLRDGGISLIEINDDGVGVPKENLADIFLAHTTTKLKSIDDLNNLLSMGFRGEALSTIVSVSKVSMISKYESESLGNQIVFNTQSDFKISSAPREKGTQIKVENLFDNIPVRKKYLKTAQTEYKNILDTLTPYFLIYPNIHWEVYKEGKQVINLLPKSQRAGSIERNRVGEVLKQEFVNRMETVFYEGNGMKISGLSSHPSDHVSRTKYQYVFVNVRSVWDSGVARAVLQGYQRYIPHGEKIPFLISIDINPDQVDVNVHPRKEEVKFLNPYRVYAAVEQAVEKSIEKLVSYKNLPINNELKPQYTPDFSNKDYQSSSKDISFGKSNSVRDSLRFSEAILQKNPIEQSQASFFQVDIQPEKKDYKHEKIVSIFQIFNKYIVIEFENEIWHIDQHAAAERITFEKLSKLTEIRNTDIQNILVPIEIKMDSADIEMIAEYLNIFNNIGFNINIDGDTILIKSLPVEFTTSNIEKLFGDIVNMEIEDTKKDLERLKLDIVATMACHTSIRTGQKLDIPLMKDVYYNLLDCDNPYSCPHGRPIVWKMKLSELDSKFDRTY